jgi:cyclic pyranopterin phosphate synthase
MDEPRQGMVDVSAKEPTHRAAVAESVLVADRQALRAIEQNALPKADPLPTARAAALLAVKNTAGLVPHCHPIQLTDATVEFSIAEAAVTIRCRVQAVAKTGAEMEALVGAAVAALTLYDMIKGVCPGARIEGLRVLEKSGGKTGDWRAEDERDS